MPVEAGDLIGRGAFADVFDARDTLTGAPCALKRLRPAAVSNRAVVALFEREPRALRQIDHPAVVRVIDAGRDAVGPYTLLERLRGPTLAEHLATNGPMAWTELAPVVERLRGALRATHAAGWVHRDVKPANVILDAVRGAVLFDFGFAWQIEDPARIRLVGEHEPGLGDPPTMAPELLARDAASIGPQTDEYGLGATIFVALTGSPPFGSGPNAELLRRQRAGLTATFAPRFCVDDAVAAELAAMLRVATLW